MTVLEALINISRDMRRRKAAKAARETLLITKKSKSNKTSNSKPKKKREEKKPVNPIEDMAKTLEIAKETSEILKNKK